MQAFPASIAIVSQSPKVILMQIDLYHDTVCPWCRIGKRHFQLALETWTGEKPEICYHTFFLNEAMPPEGADFRSYMQAKMGGRMSLEAMFEGPRRAGAPVGVKFNFEAITRAPNTLLSHQLIALAPDDKREAAIEAVYAAYFDEGRDIGQVEVLLAIAEELGWERATTEAGLADPVLAEALLAEAQQAQQMGITGVPFFILNQRLAFSGAQLPT